MGPIDQAKPWNPRDIVGLFRFLQRVWRLAIDEDTGAPRAQDEPSPDVERALHATIRKVTEDIDSLSFNTAIASMMEFVNVATGPGATRSQLGRFAAILSPFAPHIAEEIWLRLGHTSLVCDEPWPQHDPAMLVLSEIEIPVQVCGKVKGKVRIPADADEKAMEAAALADEKIQRAIEGKPVRKVIAVRGRLVNIVV
jgi:leucyl-tRNA synthetase